MAEVEDTTSIESLKLKAEKGLKRCKVLFSETKEPINPVYTKDDKDAIPASQRMKLSVKIRDEYLVVKELPPSLKKNLPVNANANENEVTDPTSSTNQIIDNLPINQEKEVDPLAGILVRRSDNPIMNESSSLIRRKQTHLVKPEWHAPWKLMRVISGHLGWVRCVDVEPGNEWFATGSGDRTIKIFDLASGTLKLSLTGHIATVRGIAISKRHPYLFSCGEDKMVKCWDLEQNKVIRHYHGHLSGVYSLSLHPTLDLLVTAGRDATVRVWDMRTKQGIHTLTSHHGTVNVVKCQEADPQIISASNDSTVKLFDLAAGKTMHTLTHHKKSVRALDLHPKEFAFASGSPDNIKQFKCPEGTFVQNYKGHDSVVNTLSINADNVMVSGADDGTLKFWDWKSGFNFHSVTSKVQPGSLDSEAGIFCSTFDKSGLRLITGEADKSIKIWKEDEDATEETHPMDWKPKLSYGASY